jgi:BASS family bile acid:Na+ symporter
MFSEIFLPIVLALIMFGVGMSLTFIDFRKIWQHPRPVLLGLVAQMILLPAVAFLLAFLSGLPPEVQAGIVLIAICPGGTTANLVTYMLKGNVALAVTLEAANAILVNITLPLLLQLTLVVFLSQTEAQVQLDAWEIITKVVLVVMLPTFAGVMVRRYFARRVQKIRKPLDYILPVLLAISFLGVILLDNPEESASLVLARLPGIVLMAVLLNVLGMLAGFYFTRRFNKRIENGVAIAVMVGLQNSSLALYIAKTMLHSQPMAEVAIVYGSFTFFSTLGIGWLLKRFYTDPIAS